jgi:hypothetical protein
MTEPLTADFRNKLELFYKYNVLISSTLCVQNQTTVANIVSSKSFLRNLLMAFLYFLILAFMFKIVDFAHFFVDLQPIRPKFKKMLLIQCSPTLCACYIPKMTFLSFTQKKPYIKTSKNTLFGTLDQIADP